MAGKLLVGDIGIWVGGIVREECGQLCPAWSILNCIAGITITKEYAMLVLQMNRKSMHRRSVSTHLEVE